MKRKIIIPAVIVALTILSILVLWHQEVAGRPILVYKGYDPVSGLEHARVVKLELRNATKRPMWLSQPNPPFSPPLWYGDIGYYAGKIAPNESVTLAWIVLDDGKPIHAGAVYYSGDFISETNFIAHCLMPPPTASTPWKDKIYYYWNKYYHPRHVIAWPEPLTFQTENPKPK